MTQNNSGKTPVFNRVLLKSNPPKKITDGSVILVGEKPDPTAVIVAIGPDAFRDWNEGHPKIGDRVLHFGAVIVHDGGPGEQYYLVDDNKIGLIVEE